MTNEYKIVILFSLDEYVKELKSKGGIRRVTEAMEALEQNRSLTDDNKKIIRTSIKHWAHHCSSFYRPYLEEAKKLMKQI